MKQIFDSHFQKILINFLIFFLCVLLLPLIFTQKYLTLNDFTATGQIGDTIGGITSPFIAIAGALLTFTAFWIQYKANIQQSKALKKQKKESKRNFRNDNFVKIIDIIYNQINIINLKLTNIEISIYNSTNPNTSKIIFKGENGLILFNDILSNYNNAKNLYAFEKILTDNRIILIELIKSVNNAAQYIYNMTNKSKVTNIDKAQLSYLFTINLNSILIILLTNIENVVINELNQNQNSEYKDCLNQFSTSIQELQNCLVKMQTISFD